MLCITAVSLKPISSIEVIISSDFFSIASLFFSKKIISDKLKLKILELFFINSSKSFSILFLSIFTKFLYLSNISWFQNRSIINFFLDH